MRRLKTAVLAIVPALVVAVAGVLSPGVAKAAFAGYAASDVLGQLDGSGNPDYTTNGTGTSATTFDYPSGTAVDTVHHRIFVNDCSNNRVLVFNLDANNNLADHTADFVLGQTDFTSNSSATTQNKMHCPYLSLVYESANDRLFVSDGSSNRILVFDLSNGISNGMNASYVLGQPGFITNTGGLGPSSLQCTEGLALDPNHDLLFVTDACNNRILVFNVNPAQISNGENASHVLGQPDFISNSTNLTQNGMHGPEDITYNPTTQQLFVGDSNNYRVLVFDLAGGISDGMNASYVLGQPDFTTTNSGDVITQNSVDRFEEGMGVDPTRNILYVANDNNNRVMVFDLSHGISNGMNASMVLGQPDFTSVTFTKSDPNNGYCSNDANYQPTQASICDPESSISVDSVNNRVYVGGSSDNRILVFNFAKLASSLNDPAVGDSYSQWMGSQFQGTPTFSVTAGSLPPGLSLDASSGLLSGTFTQAGTFNFTVQLVDDNGSAGAFTDTRAYSLVVDPAVVAAGASGTLSNTGLNVGIASGLGIALIGSATFIYRKRNNLYRLWGWKS